MLAEASAFPLLALAQLVPHWFQFEVQAAGAEIFVDRMAWVLALCAYSAWLCSQAQIPEHIARCIAVGAGAGILAIFLPRPAAMPILWGFQLAILAGLGAWLYAIRHDWWRAVFVGIAAAAHAIGALTLFPLCQIGASPDMLDLPGASYVCTVVIGPMWAALLPAGAGFVLWVLVVGAAIRHERI